MAPRSIWKCGDRVRARAPINKTNGGRGFFDEGAAEDVNEFNRDVEEDEREFRALPKVIEGGTEGTVVSAFKFSQTRWPYERPRHFKGHARPWVLVDFDGSDNPMEACEEWDLEIANDDYRVPFDNNKPMYEKYGGSIGMLQKAFRNGKAHGKYGSPYWKPS
ncbi:unnamed protein product [Prorocentrum cordatum]|uniref:Uncharacterized protein n=1 Tax=Prorocentrum cordatum TaxID=2364126 RepID=A0ABN9Y744_9DINO|nr:unnamed protein product [Polarella glacialis]